MTTFLTIIAILTVLIAVYVLWLRKWLKTKAWAQGFFAAIEPVELLLWKKSETILWSRFLMVFGALPVILDQFKSLDVPQLFAVIPAQWAPYLSLTFTVCGIVSEMLRNRTTKPIEVVAVPNDAPPAVAAAVAKVEATNAKAVLEIAVNKAHA